MRLIESLAEAAAALYRGGIDLKVAVALSLDQYHIQDPVERDALFREICRRLGMRGALRRKRKLAAAKAPAAPKQASFRFG